MDTLLSSSSDESTLQEFDFQRKCFFVQDFRYTKALKELKDEIACEMFHNRKMETSRNVLLSMMEGGQLDFNTFRRAIRITSTQRSNSPTYEESSQENLNTVQEQRRTEIIHKIENIILEVVQDISEGRNPKFILRNQKLWSNCVFEDRITLKETRNAQMVTINFGSSNSREKFSLILHLLSIIQKMMLKKSTSTKRELYYQNIDRVKNQTAIDNTVRDVCSLLQVPPWELGVLATSKGLIAGPLTLGSSSGNILTCMGAGGVLIPQDVLSFTCIKSEALFILVVEKDAIFQKLLDEDALNRLGPCILITGKGYPDVNTRLMLKLLVDTLKVPSFALVDADPHGIEIMCTYRFGSLAMSHLSDRLAVPSMQWLGIHPADICRLGAPSLQLTSRDGGKIRDLLSRPYCITQTNARLREQLEILLNNEGKCEIEGIATMSQAYLTDRYIPHKICAKDLI